MFPQRAKLNHSKTRKFLSEFVSDDRTKIARIYFGDIQTKVVTEENDDRAVLVNELFPSFTIDFYLKNRKEGTLSYPEQSLRYVEDAAENWALGIMDENDLRYLLDQQQNRKSVL